MASITKDSVFKPAVSSRDKADHTSAAARSIIDAEVAERERKTARLRQMRLDADPLEAPAARKAPAAKKAPAPKKAGAARTRKAG